MKLIKRISKLEKKINPVEGAWIAIINDEGTVSLSHHKHGKMELSSRDALKAFINDRQLNRDKNIRIIIIDPAKCKGAKPIKL